MGCGCKSKDVKTQPIKKEETTTISIKKNTTATTTTKNNGSSVRASFDYDED